MFDFGKLKIIKGPQRDAQHYSFVGIRKNTSGQLEFWLPLGFDQFPDSSFMAIKQIFFRMYKTFNKFEKNHQVRKDKKPLNRDQITVESGGYKFQNKDGDPVVLYSKIHMIESVLGIFNDLIIASVVSRLSKSDKIDYSKIEKYLHRAIYLPNDVIYIDEMHVPENNIQLTTTDLLGMFCFIYLELKEQLEEIDNINHEIKYIASKFRQTYLTSEHSLFDENSFNQTLAILKDVLNTINKHTYYKDHDYWLLFNAVESFLYGELEFASDGTAWGISNFSSVWEDMCSTYLFYEDEGKEKIFFADSNVVIGSKRISNNTIDNRAIYIRPEFDYPFYIKLGTNERYLRPDLVLIDTLSSFIEEKMNSMFYFEEILLIPGNWSFTVKPKTKLAKKILKRTLKKIPKKLNKRKNKFLKLNRNEIEGIKNGIRFTINEQTTSRDERSILIDYKYHSIRDFISPKLSRKVEKDIIKQLLYECALQCAPYKYATESQFWAPFYAHDTNTIKNNISSETLNSRIKSTGITVFKINFIKMQSVYLECQ